MNLRPRSSKQNPTDKKCEIPSHETKPRNTDKRPTKRRRLADSARVKKEICEPRTAKCKIITGFCVNSYTGPQDIYLLFNHMCTQTEGCEQRTGACEIISGFCVNIYRGPQDRHRLFNHMCTLDTPPSRNQPTNRPEQRKRERGTTQSKPTTLKDDSPGQCPHGKCVMINGFCVRDIPSKNQKDGAAIGRHCQFKKGEVHIKQQGQKPTVVSPPKRERLLTIFL